MRIYDIKIRIEMLSLRRGSSRSVSFFMSLHPDNRNSMKIRISIDEMNTSRISNGSIFPSLVLSVTQKETCGHGAKSSIYTEE